MKKNNNEIINKICVEICRESGPCLKIKDDPKACEKCKTVFFAWCVKKAIKKYEEIKTK